MPSEHAERILKDMTQEGYATLDETSRIVSIHDIAVGWNAGVAWAIEQMRGDNTGYLSFRIRGSA